MQTDEGLVKCDIAGFSGRDRDFNMAAGVFVVAVLFVVILVIATIFRKAIGRAFIIVAEVFILLANVIFVIACGLAGSVTANQSGAVYGLPQDNAALIGFIAAGLLAFLVSALVSAVFFLLVQIEFNTRKVAGYFDRMTGPQNNP
jgi:hypothetical protein